MGKVWKKGAAVALAAAVCAGALSGCGKKTDAISAFTFNGEKVDGDLANFVLRYEQASLDDIYAYYASMMQQDIWSMDDGQGLGISTWDSFKSNIGEDIERLLLAEEHASDYNVSLTDDEKKAITDAAAEFIADNDKDVLASMSATQEVVENYLTLSTIKAKVEEGMTADVDTNVPDEEAAQRSVQYIRYMPTTETETEAQSESEMAGTEAEAGNTLETEAETAADTAMTEGETSVVETEEAKKTKASGEGSAADSTSQQITEAETSAAEAGMPATEAEQTEEAGQNADEAQSESEDPAMAAAKVKYRAMADEMLESLKSGKVDMDTAISNVTSESVPGVTTSTFTFGKDDTYPDAAIIEATNDLADETLVDHIVETDDAYYILYVKDALDEAATENKKKEIIDERKQEKIDEVYEKWMADEKFDVDAEKLDAILKDRSYTAPKSDETEAAQGTLMTEETELTMEVVADTEISIETETEDK